MVSSSFTRNFFYFVFNLSLLVGCSTTSSLISGLGFPTQLGKSPHSLWKKKLPGALAHLNTSLKGDLILAGILVGSTPAESLIAFDSEGKQLWQVEVADGIDRIQIDSASRGVWVSTRNARLVSFDSKGQLLWEQNRNCRPYYLEALAQMLCVGFDARRNETSFEMMDASGKVRFSRREKGSFSAFAASDREIACVLSNRDLLLMNGQLKLRWRNKIRGDVIYLVFAGPEGRYPIALYQADSQKPGQKILAFDPKGVLLGFTPLEGFADQIIASENGKLIYLFGNGPIGQELSSQAFDPHASQEEAHFSTGWTRRHSHFARYSPRLQTYAEEVWAGYEIQKTGDPVSQAFVMGFDSQGFLRWQLPLPAVTGAFLFSPLPTAKPTLPRLVVATYEGSLEIYDFD